MKNVFTIISILLLGFWLPSAVAQCPVETTYTYGNPSIAEFSHTYYDAAENVVWAVGYFTTEITLGGSTYTTPNAAETGKYIAKLDTLGNILLSWQVQATHEVLEGGDAMSREGTGYFEPGLAFTNSSTTNVVTATMYFEAGAYRYKIEAFDRTTGATQWSQVFDSGPNKYGTLGFDAIMADTFSEIKVTGSFADSLVYNNGEPIIYGTAGETNGFLLSISEFGDVNGIIDVLGSNQIELFGLEIDGVNNLYVSGNAYGTTQVNINAVPFNYTGDNSAFIFKVASQSVDWFTPFNSTFGMEIPALKYDVSNDQIHYAGVDYPDQADSLAIDTRIGALNASFGTSVWEHSMAVPGWYYLAYSSWLDPTTQSIYYPVWIKNGAQDMSQLIMDGALLQDSISSLIVVQKFNTVTGASELISPTLHSFIGEVAVLPSGNLLAQRNYTGVGDPYTLGKMNPSSYPFFYGYLSNQGSNTVLDAVLIASTSANAGPVTFQWYQDGVAIAGATSETYVPIAAGQYYVDIVSASGCNFRTRPTNILPLTPAEQDSLALVDIYYATNPGDTAWANADFWLGGTIDQWRGVGIDVDRRVVSLDLGANNLTGVLPASMANLTAMEGLYFYDNPNLEGPLFDIVNNYPNLLYLSAGNCAFTGNIAGTVFTSILIELNLYNNQFSGNIPPAVSSALNLEIFNFSFNQLEGAIPDEITQLNNLRDLNLQGNQLTGGVPANIGDIDSLRMLNLSGNPLGGELPASIGNLAALTDLVLQNNQLSGEIPTSVENLNSLRYFELSQNNFSGNLPDVVHLPSMERIYLYSNGALNAGIPSDLDQILNLRSYHIDYTLPVGGEIPEVVFNATFMESFGLSGMNFTGEIPADKISQLTNLTELYISGNFLTGEIPVGFVALSSINSLDFSNNFFSGLPDFSANASLQFLNVAFNYLQMEDLVPNANNTFGFNYGNQRRIGSVQEIMPSIGSNETLVTEINDFAGTNYQWIFNNDTLPSATNLTYQIVNFRPSNAGAYVLQATHPDLPELILFSTFLNVKADLSKTKWYVDNNEAHTADFRDIYQAISATKAFDTIYVAGSATLYNASDVFSPRVIIGPGYFLNENPNTQFNKVTASSSYFNVTKDASGTQIYGMDLETLYLNNQSSRAPDTLKNVLLAGNRVGVLALGDKNFDIQLHRNFIKKLQVNSTFVTGVSRSYDEISISNNIIDSVTTFFAPINTTNNGLNNFSFINNTIGFVSDSINEVNFIDNIIDENLAGNSTSVGEINFATANFINQSGNLSVDSDFLTVDPNLAAGAFGGAAPYILSGLPPIPVITNLLVGPRLSVILNARNINDAPIETVRYVYRRNNQNTTAFNVTGFSPEQTLEVQFLPNRSQIQANLSYELVFVAIDANGQRSHRTYVPYNATAANLSGTVIDLNAVPVNKSNIRLFAINRYANKYDTAAVQTLNGTNQFNFQDIILGEYIVLAAPDAADYPDLLPTYLGNTIDWQLADTLSLQGNTTQIAIEVEKIPEPTTEITFGSISGVFEENFEESDTSLRVLPRRRIDGAGVSVRRLSGSTREGSLRLIGNAEELIAFTRTDENGNYSLEDLPEGSYVIRFEYPGVVMDETSDVGFNITDDISEELELNAEAVGGRVVVTQTIITASRNQKKIKIAVYPNPANSVLNIIAEDVLTDTEIQILDLNGRTLHKDLFHGSNKSVDISAYDSGLYIVRILNKQGLYLSMKVLKN